MNNLTSQVFANFYLTELDHFIKHTLQIKHYIRYVDDFIVIDNDKSKLKPVIPIVRAFLKNNLELCLHPKKIILKDCNKGFEYLGCFIKTDFITSSRRVKNNFVDKLKMYWCILNSNVPNKQILKNIQESMNSYLGIMVHYETYRFRFNQLKKYSAPFIKKHFKLTTEVRKLSLKN